MQYTYAYRSPLGGITIASDGENLTGLWFEGQRYFGNTLCAEHCERMLPVFVQTIEWLDCYFGGGKPDFMPSLNPAGTPFRQTVWKALLQIPYGETVSYGELAAEIARQRGAGGSARAVGGAVGRNPVSVIIPCHRVVGSGGCLTGYAGGLTRKTALLTLEGIDTSRFFVPKHGTAL